MTIKTLLFSTLYPSSVRSIHGIFVETRLRELLKSGEVETRVVAPVPWFPFCSEMFGDYAQFARTPYYERRNDIDVFHPCYFLLPKVGMTTAPYLLALGALPTIRRLIREGFDFDLIDAHYYYPDGVAAGFIAKWIGKPFVVTARGSDLNLIPQYSHPRRLIVRTAAQASASIGVSSALVERFVEMGANCSRLHVMRNGVDLQRFAPVSKAQARQYINETTDARILLSVGNLVELKGHHIVIEATARLPEQTKLLIVGSGPERGQLERLARDLHVEERVRFVGRIANDELKWWYGAADVLALCSSREGWPNVLLEAMACGTPVIATDVGGIPEIVSEPLSGRLMKSRTPEAFIDAYRELFTSCPESPAVRAYAERFGWESTTKAQIDLFSKICCHQGQS